MITWEYKVITFGAPPPGEPGPVAAITEELNALGAEGWEAFAYNVYAGAFFLKRPTQAPR